MPESDRAATGRSPPLTAYELLRDRSVAGHTRRIGDRGRRMTVSVNPGSAARLAASAAEAGTGPSALDRATRLVRAARIAPPANATPHPLRWTGG